MSQLAIKEDDYAELVSALKQEMDIYPLSEVIGALVGALEMRLEGIPSDTSNLYKNMQLVIDSLESVQGLACDLVRKEVVGETELSTPVAYSRRRIARNNLLIAISDIKVMS